MDKEIDTFSLVLPESLKREYAMAKASKIIKGKDMQSLMRMKFKEALDSLIWKSKTQETQKSNGHTVLDNKSGIVEQPHIEIS